jgi:hypothetical protein
VEYFTVDYIANAKVSILVRPMSAFVEIQVLRREPLGDSQSNVRFEDNIYYIGINRKYSNIHI